LIPGAAPLLIGAAVPLGWAAARIARRLARPARTPPDWAVIATAIVMAATACVAASRGGSNPAGALLGLALLAAATVDLADLRLPDAVTLPAALAGLVFAAAGLTTDRPMLAFAPAALLGHAIGAAGGYAALATIAAGFRHLRGKDGLGLGDAKLAAVAGAWLGWRPLPSVVLIACALAFVWVAARLLRGGRAAATAPLPFGVPLAAAIWIAWIAPALSPA